LELPERLITSVVNKTKEVRKQDILLYRYCQISFLRLFVIFRTSAQTQGFKCGVNVYCPWNLLANPNNIQKKNKNVRKSM